MTKTKTVYQYQKQYINNKGFSLVEMLMALLVASLLMAALAPVMTKKMHDNLNIAVNGSNQSKGWRLYTYSSDCTKAEGEGNVCEFNDFKVPKDVYSVNLVMVSDGGGGAGATAETLSDPITITKTAEGIKTDEKQYDEQIIPITKYMTDVKIAALIGGGGGGGGGSGKDGLIPSEKTCKDYGTGKTDTVGNTGENFAVYDSANKLCVTIHNQHAGDGCNYMGTYSGCTGSGCNRWVCNHSSGQQACSDLGKDWRLPVKSETDKWNNVAIWKTLDLCSYAGNSVYLCPNSNVNGSPAFAYGVRTSTPVNSNYYVYCLNPGGISYYTNHTPNMPFSIRCVLDKTFKSIKGGRGADASIISNVNISDYIKQAGTGGQIVLRAGKGGKGGDGAQEAGKNAESGYDGYRSCIYVQKKPVTGAYGDTVYAVCAYEGKGGNKGDITSANDGKDADNASYCREYIKGSWKDFGCSISTNASYGTEGIGGSAIYSSDSTITMQKGSNGTGGIAEITYKNEFKGAGGGGGAGGTFAKLTNLSISNDTECVIKIGGGGNYGSGQNGKDGGNTSIKCGNSKEYIIYGGKGGKLGTSGKDINNPEPVGGKAGDTGKVSENIIQLGTLAEIIYGEGMGNNITEETAFKINGNLNIGGNGGKSGTNATGGCGGLRPDSDPDCTNPNQNATQAEYITPLYSSLIQETPDYGKTGAGGGAEDGVKIFLQNKEQARRGSRGIYSSGGIKQQNKTTGCCKNYKIF